MLSLDRQAITSVGEPTERTADKHAARPNRDTDVVGLKRQQRDYRHDEGWRSAGLRAMAF